MRDMSIPTPADHDAVSGAREKRVPGWMRVVLLIASAPVLAGAVVMVYQAGVSGPVLIGGILGPLIGLAWHRRRTPRPPP
ncbi:MAG: hypothetical protein ACRDTC_23090 [Pseudonocardiaceae bacterium]